MWVTVRQVGPAKGIFTKFLLRDSSGRTMTCRRLALPGVLEDLLKGFVVFDVRDLGEIAHVAMVANRKGGGAALVLRDEYGGAVIREQMEP